MQLTNLVYEEIGRSKKTNAVNSSFERTETWAMLTVQLLDGDCMKMARADG